MGLDQGKAGPAFDQLFIRIEEEFSGAPDLF
jgi:hypothetical protein